MIRRFSPKQRRVLRWWCPASADSRYDGIICDGAVRSGKTLCLGLSFFLWSLTAFQRGEFALCGRTLGAVRRNLWFPLSRQLQELGIVCREKLSQGYVELEWQGRQGRYWLFAGEDEGCAARIQGMTLAGAIFDEAALLCRSFVEQAAARCSQEGARLWFSCNPEYPEHWFYREWILKSQEKNLLYLHFTMEDNPGLSSGMRKRYQRLYSGSFYRRFVLGEWAAAQGLVYPMFSRGKNVTQRQPECQSYWISCDYGTVNPCSMGLWGLRDGVYYRLAEWYHDSRKSGVLMTDEEYYQKLEELAGGRRIRMVIVDPSAASFIQCIRRHGRFLAQPAKNQVSDGIRLVSELLRQGKIQIWEGCEDCLRELGSYRWEEKGEDRPHKENDHAMDEMRYFIMEMAGQRPGRGGFWAAAGPERNSF